MAGVCLNDTMCKRCGFRGEEHECSVEYKPDAENPYEDYTCGWCNEKGHPPTWTGCAYWTERKKAIGKAQAKKNSERMIRFNNRTSNGRVTFVSAPLPTTSAWNMSGQQQRQQPEQKQQQSGKPRQSMEEAIKECQGKVQETRLGEKHKLKLTGMRVYRSDEGVGTCVAVSNEIESGKVILNGMENNSRITMDKCSNHGWSTATC